MTQEYENSKSSLEDQIRMANRVRYDNLNEVDNYLRRPYHALRLSLSIQLLKSEIGRVFPDMPTSEIKILELASSTGKAAIELSKAGYDVIASDIEVLPLARAREVGLKCVQIDATQKFPFPNKFMHAMLMGELIEHIFDIRGLL